MLRHYAELHIQIDGGADGIGDGNLNDKPSSSQFAGSSLSRRHGGHQELPVRLVREEETDSQLRHPRSREQEQAEVPVRGESQLLAGPPHWCSSSPGNKISSDLSSDVYPFITRHSPTSLQVRVGSFNYIGMGNSTNKKDAQTNAARDFVNYLVRIGEMNAAEVPALGVSNLLSRSSGWRRR